MPIVVFKQKTAYERRISDWSSDVCSSDLTTVARGLFIDNIDNTIVARSYEKFFNHGEKTETSDDALQSSLAFPVEGFDKANGFLCITGYSERTGRSEEHTSELQSLMRISYAVFCLKKKHNQQDTTYTKRTNI